jgi:glycosyltransferase involved in cell wall biosynthesis
VGNDLMTFRTCTPISTQRWLDGTPPLASIICRTYNHSKYIKDAIEGFLKQETSFPVEILIFDDASDDGAQDIIRSYAEQYPQSIFATLQVENQYKKFPKTDKYIAEPIPRGKYIAKCEGDDYWEDETKLEKQVQFLENNKEYVVAYHDAKVIDEEGKLLHESRLSSNAYTYKDKKKPDKDKRDFTATELMLGARILFLTICYRNVIEKRPDEAIRSFAGDRWLSVLLGEHGKGKYMGDQIRPAVYRRHRGGVSYNMLSDNSKNRKRMKLEILMSFCEMFLYHCRTKDEEFAISFLNQTLYGHIREILKKEYEKDIKDTITYKVGLFFTFLPKTIIKTIKYLYNKIN